MLFEDDWERDIEKRTNKKPSSQRVTFRPNVRLYIKVDDQTRPARWSSAGGGKTVGLGDEG